jgi:hypothetical protein
MNNVTSFPESKLSRAVEISGQLSEELARNEVPGNVSGSGPGEQGAGNLGGGTLAPVAPGLPLHELEENLMAMVDTEAMVTPEQEEQFLAELSQGLQLVKAKRDRVAAFIRQAEADAAYAADEIKRLQARKRILENAAERVRGYVLWIIEALGPDTKGKLRKLEGEKFTFAARALKPKLEITDETLIPNAYKRVSLDVPAELYVKYSGVLHALGMLPPTAKYSIDEPALREALEAAPQMCWACEGSGKRQIELGDQVFETCPNCGGSGVLEPSVPGAKLVDGRLSLVVR